MALARKSPSIDKTLPRVHLNAREVEEVCKEMSFNGPVLIIEADGHTASSWADLTDFPSPVVRHLVVRDSKYDLRVTFTPDWTEVSSIVEPSPDMRDAWAHIEVIIKPRFRSRFFDRRLAVIYALLGLAAGLTLIALASIPAVDGWSSNQRSGAIAGALVVASPVALFIVGKFPVNPPPIILRECEWKSRGFLKRHGLDLGLLLTLIGAVAGVLALFQ